MEQGGPGVIRLLSFLLAASSAAIAFQAVEPGRTAYERRGLYHANIRGRVVTPSGAPVAGVHLQLRAGPVRALPLMEAVTGGDGRFAMREVNATYPPFLMVFPPEGWVASGGPVAVESGGDLDVGTIRLTPSSTVRVQLEVAGGVGGGGASLREWNDSPSVVAFESEAESAQRIVAAGSGNEFVLSNVPFETGILEVSLYPKTGPESYMAPFTWPAAKRNGKLKVRVYRKSRGKLGVFGREGSLDVRVEEAPAPAPASEGREFVMSGRIVAPDGSPVAGAIVSNFNEPVDTGQKTWTRSGDDGKYTLRYRGPKCILPNVSYFDSDYLYSFGWQPNVVCEKWLESPQTLTLRRATRLALRVTGSVDPSKAKADWWHESFGWQRFSSLRPWISLDGFQLKSKVRVSAEGFLPLIAKFPEKLAWSREQAPAEVPLEFRFDGAVERELAVTSGGRPIQGTAVTVDVDSIDDLDSDARTLLSTYRLPPNGRLALRGGNPLVEVFVYAEGYEPRRAIWNPGSPLSVDLVARNAVVEFPGSRTAKARAVRIRPAGSPAAVRTVLLDPHGRPTVARVAPGTYELTCYGADGAVLGYQRVLLSGPLARKTIDCSADERPRLTVRLPGEKWRFGVTESGPRGGATHFVAMILTPGAPGVHESGYTELGGSKQEKVLALSHAGRWHIEAAAEKSSMTMWLDFEVTPKGALTLTVPTGSATLRGSMRTYGGGLERSPHGFAGPRIQLLADDPSGKAWSVTDYIPQRDAQEGEARHRFTMSGLPQGRYHLVQHLIGEPMKISSMNFTHPIAAWGGIAVELKDGAATTLKDFADYGPLSNLSVRVTDAAGHRVEHATIRVRDRMSDSWRQVEENPFQIEQAAHSIPYPPAARIVEGKATLPKIRQGWLEFLVECDWGPVYRYVMPVAPERGELRVTLPAAQP